SGVAVTALRAAMIIGSGSASFEILRHLTERLPVMITPRWVRTECQPIAVRAVGVRAPTGLTLPLVSDPDGAVVALGFPEGMIEFETSREVLAPGDDSAQSGSTKKR
ncbi:MAG TPA: hypothetical protein PKD61_10795, partial [Polyangiaceae bacterium]|nr:hypothetical protein [Polyangiaceae bacterium]